MKFKVKKQDIFSLEEGEVFLSLNEYFIYLFDEYFYFPLVCKLRHWYLDNLSRPLRRIKTILSYVPLLWYDYDWDHSYLYKILKHKLEKMAPVIGDGIALDSKKHEKEIRICINLLDRLIKEDYDSQLDKLRREFKVKTKIKKLENGNTQISSVVNNGTEKQYSKAFKREVKKAEKLRKQDKKLLFKIMERKIDSWWD